MKNETPFCWMLIGLPGVGKSTYVKDRLQNRSVKFWHLSSDAYIEIQAAMRNKTYGEVFKDCIAEAQNLFFGDIKTFTAHNDNVMIDRTNLTVQSRKKVLDMIPANYKKVAVVFICSDKLHQKRLLERSYKTIPQYVIDQMKSIYVWPTKAEGFDSITFIDCDKQEEFAV